MQSHPITLSVVPKVSEIENALSFGYTYYPVVNTSGHVVGSICSDFLITLLEQKAFYRLSVSSRSQTNAARNTNAHTNSQINE